MKRLTWHFWIAGGALLAVLTQDVSAHERWVLTPEQIEYFNSLPKPPIYSELTLANFSIVTVFLVFIFGWIRLGYTGARELFPDLQARLASYGEHVPRILRFCLTWMLVSSALGLEPRTGVEPFTSPTLFAPDLELKNLSPIWGWLHLLELLLGVGIFFGIYVRVCAVLLMGLGLLGGWLFGPGFLAYGGAILGACLYLLLQGPGRHYLPLPTLASMQPVVDWLAAQPRSRAQFILRVLTGFTYLYLGIHYKIMQPNLAVGILETYKVPLMSSAPEAFSLIMALVEVSAGFLLIAGVLLRPLALFLLFAFFVFASLLPETLTEHILFYGVMLSCLINSAGHWQRPVAKDKKAEILIVGGGFAAMHAAIKIERLIGTYTNVRVTLLHDNSNFVLTPLLPEVIGGSVQPNNVVNPLRRVIPRVNMIIGHLDSIDEEHREVMARRANGERIKLSYSELILAPTPIPKTASIPGMLSHALPIDSTGDALHIRKCLSDAVEQAEFNSDRDNSAQLLNLAIIGSGEMACSVAAEICQMIRAMEHNYPVLSESGWRVHLYDDVDYVFSDFEIQHQALRDRCLEKAGVTLHKGEKISSLGEREIVMADGARQPVSIVINASLSTPAVRLQGGEGLRWPLSTNTNLSLLGHEHIWIAGPRQGEPEKAFMTAADWENLGKDAGYNAWATSQGFSVHPHRQRNWLAIPYGIGFQSFCSLKVVSFSGIAAWFLCRLSNLLAMPGLEKNLRIIIDWAMVIPFRSDIGVTSTSATSRLQKIRFEKGEEIFRQGDEAHMAYVVESGRLEIIKDDKKVGELGAGDFFGEIAQNYLNRRSETVRCISPCELTVLSQSDFKALTKGSGLMNKALQHLARNPVKKTEIEGGIKRIMYVSTMHAHFTDEEIVELGRLSSVNNSRLGLTGILISVHEYFFQIIEGQESVLDALLDKIRSDSRHRDLTILSVELGLEERMFTDWGMRTVTLGEESGVMLQAIRMMLRTITQSHHIIGHYTQPAVLKFLTEGINPLTVPPEKTQKLVMFANLSGLSGRLSAQSMTEIMQEFFEICSSCVIEHRGQVADYVGSSVFAYFPADLADAAISSALDTIQGLKEIASRGNSSMKDVVVGIGLASGNVIEGNVGSSLKMNYTLMGDAMEEATRLESFSSRTGKAIVLSDSVRQASKSEWVFQAFNETSDSSIDSAETVYTIDHPLMNEFRPAKAKRTRKTVKQSTKNTTNPN